MMTFSLKNRLCHETYWGTFLNGEWWLNTGKMYGYNSGNAALQILDSTSKDYKFMKGGDQAAGKLFIGAPG